MTTWTLKISRAGSALYNGRGGLCFPMAALALGGEASDAEIIFAAIERAKARIATRRRAGGAGLPGASLPGEGAANGEAYGADFGRIIVEAEGRAAFDVVSL